MSKYGAVRDRPSRLRAESPRTDQFQEGPGRPTAAHENPRQLFLCESGVWPAGQWSGRDDRKFFKPLRHEPPSSPPLYLALSCHRETSDAGTDASYATARDGFRASRSETVSPRQNPPATKPSLPDITRVAPRQKINAAASEVCEGGYLKTLLRKHAVVLYPGTVAFSTRLETTDRLRSELDGRARSDIYENSLKRSPDPPVFLSGRLQGQTHGRNNPRGRPLLHLSGVKRVFCSSPNAWQGRVPHKSGLTCNRLGTDALNVKVDRANLLEKEMVLRSALRIESEKNNIFTSSLGNSASSPLAVEEAREKSLCCPVLQRLMHSAWAGRLCPCAAGVQCDSQAGEDRISSTGEDVGSNELKKIGTDYVEDLLQLMCYKKNESIRPTEEGDSLSDRL
ncbi:hypothetical protein Bbelb_181550 [Branchiostoma belcheri]|nr:hypothetical protein Bbelb_181550 [Branchiostoma belcheri]